MLIIINYIYNILVYLLIILNMKYIWRQINVWFWVEDTRGQVATITHWQPKTDFSFEENMQTIQDESSIWIIVDSRDTFVVKRFWEGEIWWNVEVNWIWYLLLATLWLIESDVDTVWAYKHTFSLDNSNQIQSLTIWLNDPVIWDYNYTLANIDSFTLSAEEGQFATFTVNFKSKPWEVQFLEHNVIYDVDNKLLARHSIFRVAENLSWLNSAVDFCLRSFEITFTKNLEDDYCIWDIAPKDFINQAFSIEWNFTAVFQNTQFRENALLWNKRAIRFELKNLDSVIWETSNPRLTIDLPLASFTEFSRAQWNDETVIQTLTFKWLYSAIDNSAVNIELVNTKQEYIETSI
jgi:hypothetical protein